MSKLDAVIERIRQLPPERQDAAAAELEFWLNHIDEAGESLLTDEQWAEVEQALADDNEPTISHEELFASLRSPAST